MQIVQNKTAFYSLAHTAKRVATLSDKVNKKCKSVENKFKIVYLWV